MIRFKEGRPTCLPNAQTPHNSLSMENLHQKYEGLVFDMDGTLADTMPTHFVAWTRILAKHGIEFPEDRFYSLGGVPAPDIVKMMAAEQRIEIDVVAVAEEKEALFVDLLSEVRPVEMVKAIAEQHREHMPMAIATGAPMWMADKILAALDIRDWFSAVVTADCVKNPKPAPDVYLKAARLIGVNPKRCHAFEDTVLGMEAASNAGMVVVDVNTLREGRLRS